MAAINSFEDLACWKEARKLKIFVSKTIIPKFPNSEKYELVSQMRRSSRSVGNNISEGFGRFHFQENIQFCRSARGSLDETLDHGIIALDDSYITETDLKELREIHNKVLIILNGYIKYLKAQKNR